MQRNVTAALERWLGDSRRRPLILRGARQVGKTWLVRDLARRAGRELIELNFERDPGLAAHFASNDPSRVVAELGLWRGRRVDPATCLLFLDEIQAAGALLSKLRWFAEELPILPVIAAGSLLELALADHAHGVPVGRVGYLHVEPLGFGEYLRAHDASMLIDELSAWRPGNALSPSAHEQAMVWWHRFAMVGGMPSVVEDDVATGDPQRCRDRQLDLTATYRDDFAKYATRLDRELLEQVFVRAVGAVGESLKYSALADADSRRVKRALEALRAARVIHVVRHTHANGLPLGGEGSDRLRKVIAVDVGVVHAVLRTPAVGAFPAWEQLTPTVRGQLADQLAGQELRLQDAATGDGPALYYWHREGGRSGEVDYVIARGGRIVPIELKAGRAGAMKSLHQFMYDKRLELAVRIDANPPSLASIEVATTQGDRVSYRLLSIPHSMVGWLGELIDRL